MMLWDRACQSGQHKNETVQSAPVCSTEGRQPSHLFVEEVQSGLQEHGNSQQPAHKEQMHVIINSH